MAGTRAGPSAEYLVVCYTRAGPSAFPWCQWQVPAPAMARVCNPGEIWQVPAPARLLSIQCTVDGCTAPAMARVCNPGEIWQVPAPARLLSIQCTVDGCTAPAMARVCNPGELHTPNKKQHSHKIAKQN
jgi:hypothetical protein